MRAETPTLKSLSHRDIHAALLVSAFSVAWTLSASIVAIALGVESSTGVLVAFGAIGLVDAVGSVALAYHFQQARRHGRLLDHLEALSHRVVLAGLLAVGSASIGGGIFRLTIVHDGGSSRAGVALAAVSVIVLVALSIRKQQVASRVSSAALVTDGHLSAIGAMQAAVTLAGTAVVVAFKWHWADALATILVGAVAVAIAAASWRTRASHVD